VEAFWFGVLFGFIVGGIIGALAMSALMQDRENSG
jgi:hypothetical protein